MVTLLRDHVMLTGQTLFEAHGHATYVFSVASAGCHGLLVNPCCLK